MEASFLTRKAFAIALGLITTNLAALHILQLVWRPRYPGPLLAKITKWQLRYHEVRNTREQFIESLHKKYGPFVQIAPKQVSVNSADGLRDIFSVTKRLDRPSPVPLLHLYHTENLVSTESGQLHHERRKPLRSIYTVRAVEGEHMQAVFKTLLGRLVEYVDQKSQAGRPVDAIALARLYAADVGSHVVYGSHHSLNLLGDETQRLEFQKDLKWTDSRFLTVWSLLMLWYPHFALRLRRVGLTPKSLPGGVPDGLMMNKKGREMLTKLLSGDTGKGHSQTDTLLERLISEYREHGPSIAMPDTDYLLSETLDHFWAGVTTTGDALAATFYHLSHPQNKPRQEKLRQELKVAGIHAGGEVSLSKVKGIAYLDFIVRESLRLAPPVAFSLSRKVTGQEGLEILGHWLPPGMEVGAQPYSIHRNVDAFSDPETWNPERWDTDNDLDKFRSMKRYSFAFGAGPRMCIGMPLAMTEMKMLVARIFSTYAAELSPEWFLGNGEVRPEGDRGELWPLKNKPWKKREPIVFRRI